MTPFVLLYFSVPNFRTFAAIAQSVVKYAILKTSMFYKAVGPENIKYSKDSLVKTSMFCKQIFIAGVFSLALSCYHDIDGHAQPAPREGVCKPHRDAYGAYTARS